MSKDFLYKPTTSTWKIKRLFENDSRLFIIQGGQGAGKTISILMIILDFLNSTFGEVTICSAQSSKLSDTALRDFIKIAQDWNIYNNFKHNSSENTFTNELTNSYCEFIGLDKKDVGKGRRRDIVYINEANKITLQQFTDISARAKLVILDYNPDAYFWAHDLITEDNFINLCYLDNEYLSAQEVANIENYKTLAYNPDETIRSEYWLNTWKVYGLGQIGSAEGKIFDGWVKTDYGTFLNYNVPEVYLVDWGIVDPMAISKVKFIQEEKKIAIHELNYLSENEIRKQLSQPELLQIKDNEGGIILYKFNHLQIPKDALILCDSANKDNIDILRRNGYLKVMPVKKEQIHTGIRLLQSINIEYTANSTNLIKEYNNYTWAKDRLGFINETPIDEFNHLIDGLRYFAVYLKQIGLINSY